jgi:hypothetical protein
MDHAVEEASLNRQWVYVVLVLVLVSTLFLSEWRTVFCTHASEASGTVNEIRVGDLCRSWFELPAGGRHSAQRLVEECTVTCGVWGPHVRGHGSRQALCEAPVVSVIQCTVSSRKARNLHEAEWFLFLAPCFDSQLWGFDLFRWTQAVLQALSWFSSGAACSCSCNVYAFVGVTNVMTMN